VSKGILTSLISAILLLTLSGCINTTDPKVSFKPPKYVEELPSREEERIFGNLGSLYGQGDQPLFADRKAMKVNDLLTVVIQENVQSSTSNSKSLSETGGYGLNGPRFTAGTTNGVADTLATNLNRHTDLSIGMDTSNTFDGSGTKSASGSFTTTVTARVIKILNNGNYFIDGQREMLIDGEKQMIRVSGVVNPYDIDSDNSVNSRYLADARVLYETQGDIKRSTERGWAGKAIDAIWPF